MDWGIEEWSVLGMWASAIATFTAAIVSLRIASKSNKPKLKVNVVMGYLVGSTSSKLMIIITGTNAGAMPVNLVSSDIQLPKKFFKNKGSIFFPYEIGQILPKKLEPSESTSYDIEPDNLSKKLKELGYRGTYKLKVFFGDSLGNRYKGKIKIHVK